MIRNKVLINTALGILLFVLVGCLTRAEPPTDVTDAFNPYSEKDVAIQGKSKAIILSILAEAEPNRTFTFTKFYEKYVHKFIGLPYGAGAISVPAGKTLVNAESFDCVTFVETMLALALTYKELNHLPQKTSPQDQFKRFIKHFYDVRFYNGMNCSGEDRLHYFTAALTKFRNKGLLIDVAKQNGIPFNRPIYYISSNITKFGGIKDINRLKAQEQDLQKATLFYYPKSELYLYEKIARTGDIVAWASTVDGLDVSHCGFIHADAQSKTIAMTHASSLQSKVLLKDDICTHLHKRKTLHGIFVFRPTF